MIRPYSHLRTPRLNSVVEMTSVFEKATRAIITATKKVVTEPATALSDDGYESIGDNTRISRQAAGEANDGFLTVFHADDNTDGTTDDEDFELISPHQHFEATTGALISAESVEDEPGVPFTATCCEIIKAMTEPELVEYCAKVHLPRLRMGPDELQGHHSTLTASLQVLASCSYEWFELADFIAALRQRIMDRLYSLPEHTQWCVARLLGKLLGCENWIEHDLEVVEVGDFEISAALWLFKVGVREFALAIVQPCTALELALACEQGWLLQSVGDEGKTELQGLVADLQSWGREVEMRGENYDTQGV